MRAILIGAGGTSRELLRRLGHGWEITVVDTCADRLQSARGIRPFHEVEGDGSSAVVLKRAGLGEADAVVAATDDHDANLEICRLARAAGVLRILAVAPQPERAEEFRPLEVGLAAPDALAARELELSLESRRVSSKAFAHGRAEAIELRVAHDSPVRGKALKDLHARSFIVGAVLRNGRLVIPHGDTVLQKDDLVTVVGAGAEFADIVQTFTAGEARFPLNYGKRVAAALETQEDLEGPVAEAIYLARNTRATSLLLVHRDPVRIRDADVADRVRSLLERARAQAEGVEVRARGVVGAPAAALESIPEEESIGVIVVAVPPGGRLARRAAARRSLALARRAGVPVLVSRRTHPYGRLLVPARRTPPGRAAARAAIDLARQGGGSLIGLAAVDPVFQVGPEGERAARGAVGWLTEEASVQGVEVHGEIRRGNPVRAFVAEAQRKDLLVLGAGERPGGLFRPEVSGHIARRVGCSVLLIPPLE